MMQEAVSILFSLWLLLKESQDRELQSNLQYRLLAHSNALKTQLIVFLMLQIV
jgi:hypothetical protein